MRLRALLALAGLGAMVILTGASVRAEGISKDALEGLARDLDAAAASGIPDKPDVALDGKLKAVTYDEKSISALISVLGTGRKVPVDTYVATKLLGPLTTASADVIKKAFPAVESIARKYVRYLDFPKLSQAEIAALRLPDSSTISVERLVEMKAEAQKRQDAKVAREKGIKQQNEQSYKLDMLLYRLALLAGNDQDVIAAVAMTEQKGQETFSDILDLIRAEAGRLGETRAKVYYGGLGSIAQRVWLKKANYRDMGAVKLSTLDNSGYATKELKPAQVIVQTLNQIATAAKLSAANPPSDKDIDNATKKNGASGSRSTAGGGSSGSAAKPPARPAAPKK
jgi:hypothetical protein